MVGEIEVVILASISTSVPKGRTAVNLTHNVSIRKVLTSATVWLAGDTKALVHAWILTNVMKDGTPAHQTHTV